MKNLPFIFSVFRAFKEGWLTIWLICLENRIAFSEQLTSNLKRIIESVRHDTRLRSTIAATKEMLLKANKQHREAMLDLAALRFSEFKMNEEEHEGVASFIGKRKPAWSLSDNA